VKEEIEREREKERKREGGRREGKSATTMGSAVEHEPAATAKVSHLSCSLTTLNDTKRHV